MATVSCTKGVLEGMLVTPSNTFVTGKGPDNTEILFSVQRIGKNYVHIFLKRKEGSRELGWYCFEANMESDDPVKAMVARVKELADRLLTLPRERYQQFFTSLTETKEKKVKEGIFYLPFSIVEEAL